MFAFKRFQMLSIGVTATLFTVADCEALRAEQGVPVHPAAKSAKQSVPVHSAAKSAKQGVPVRSAANAAKQGGPVHSAGKAPVHRVAGDANQMYSESDSVRSAIFDRLAQAFGLPRNEVAAGARIDSIPEPVLTRLFPSTAFYSVQLQHLPQSAGNGEPVPEHIIFASEKDGTSKILKNKGDIETLFGETQKSVRTDAVAKDLVTAWLTLSGELSYGGKASFSIPADAAGVQRDADGRLLRASGKAIAQGARGKSGDVGVTITFDSDGDLSEIHEASMLEPPGAAKAMP